MKFKLLIISLILIFLTTAGLGCKGGDSTAKKAMLQPVELNMWGIFDSSDAFEKIITSYRAIHPNVTIKFTKLRYEEYEKKIVDSWAAGQGPDIFAVHNSWIGRYDNKILPMPQTVKLPALEITGTIKKESTAVIKENSTITTVQLKNIFPDVVYKDVVKNNAIYALPLSVDTLALFYNRDLLNAAGITDPPATWAEVVLMVKKLIRTSAVGDIERAGIAMGGAENINRSFDILSLLMQQHGTPMTNSSNVITFNRPVNLVNGEQSYPAENALRFYTDFALPSKEAYTWNNKLPEALELFSAGKLALMFGYAYQIPLLKTQAPRINWGVAPVPHFRTDGADALGLPINYANYWLYTVYKNSPHPNEAWDFINFMTNGTYRDAENKTKYYAEYYLNITNYPPALKSLINSYKEKNPESAPFADQILTAASWYHGKNPNQAMEVFRQMINNVVAGKLKLRDALNNAATAISEAY